MKKFKFTINGNPYEVEIASVENNIANVEVNGTKYSVEVEEQKKTSKTPTLVRRPVVTKKEIEKTESTSETIIIAPLPGTILDIKKKEGDAVKKGDVILIMEAMKMENNILAEKDGTITSLNAMIGATVLQGDILVKIN